MYCVYIYIYIYIYIYLFIYLFTYTCIGYWPRLELVEGVESNEASTPYAVGGVIIDRLERFQYRFRFSKTG